MNLLDLNSELQELNELIDSVTSSEIPPELESAFKDLLNQQEETEAAYLEKIDNIIALIQSRKYWIEVRQQELKRLTRLIRSDRSLLNWLQSYLLNHLQSKELNQLRTKRFNLTVADNGGKRPLIVEDIPARLVTKQPRLLVLNRSQPLMSNETETVPYNKAKFDEGGYKAFSYVIVGFLDSNNQPLSELPFRLRCSGYAGITFLKNFSYYNTADSFCKKFLQTYKALTGDKAAEKNNVFYAHAVYQPTLVREKATSSVNGKSSYAVITKSFLEPTRDNFTSLIVKNGSSTSDRIKQLIETTKSWLKTEAVETEEQNTKSEELEQDVVETDLPSDPVPF